MLLVNATKGPSKIHGDGLIAREFIPANTLVWSFNSIIDKEITIEEYSILPEHIQSFLDIYTYYWNGVLIMPGDYDKYTNHSDNPNIRDLPNGDGIAIRDIQEGEEITWDYKNLVRGF